MPILSMPPQISYVIRLFVSCLRIDSGEDSAVHKTRVHLSPVFATLTEAAEFCFWIPAAYEQAVLPAAYDCVFGDVELGTIQMHD